jgi:hypothetical protein
VDIILSEIRIPSWIKPFPINSYRSKGSHIIVVNWSVTHQFSTIRSLATISDSSIRLGVIVVELVIWEVVREFWNTSAVHVSIAIETFFWLSGVLRVNLEFIRLINRYPTSVKHIVMPVIRRISHYIGNIWADEFRWTNLGISDNHSIKDDINMIKVSS